MKSLKQILQKAVIYPVIIGQLLLGSYACGPDDSQPNPNEDAQVQVDSGYDAGTLEDVLNTPDANGQDVPNGDNIPNGDDAVYVDASDGGTDVYFIDGGIDADLTDVPYVDGGDVDLTDVLDGGYDANDVGPGDTGGDNEQIDGGNLAPVPKLRYSIKDPYEWIDVNEGDTVTRPLNEYIVWDVCSSYDPDGKIMEIWKNDWGDSGNGTLIYKDGKTCKYSTDTTNVPKDNLPSYILVKDDKGAESKLNFTYKTE